MIEPTVPFALYDAFSEELFGGSQGGIVLNAGDINAQTRQKIASELGLPATCFVSSIAENTVTAQFHSTEREYPMCGHGTICLMSHLLGEGMLQMGDDSRLEIELVLPTKTALVEILAQDDAPALVMLDIALANFQSDQPDVKILARMLGLKETDIEPASPIETALGDFVHLIVPINGLQAMQSIQPDFPEITSFCLEQNIETIACFCPETLQEKYDFHVRNFCPAVGVAESAAAGTTNAALAVYWHRHGLLAENDDGVNNVKVEQGLELGRPSSIHITLHSDHEEISRLQVGGVARKVIAGQLTLPRA